MSIRKKVLGKTPAGEEAALYIMTNKNGLMASVSDLGATWTGLCAPDRNGAFADVLLGYDTAELLYHNPGDLGALVGRNANRVRDARFSLNGKEYQLAQNNGAHNLHSGPDKLQKRVYRTKYSEREDADCICFSLRSPSGDQGYPGELFIEISYIFTDKNDLMILYKLTAGSEATVANFTSHPYFNLGGHKSGSALGQKIQIFADRFCESDADTVPTGRLLSVEHTPFDFRTPKPLSADIAAEDEQLRYGNGYDHNFCLNHSFGRTSLAATAYDPDSGRFMELYTGMPGLQLYSGNYLDPEITAKEGAHYRPRDGYALEAQYFPNAINVPEWARPVLSAGEISYSITMYRFGVKEVE